MSGRNTTVRDQHRKVIARGKPPCGICGDPIDYALAFVPDQHGQRCKGTGCTGCTPHPMRFEVDHIIPVDKGGADDLDNKQASHRVCNRIKWNRTHDELGPRTFVTTRSWW